MALAGPKTTVLVWPDFTIMFGVPEIEGLGTEQIFHPDPVRPQIKPSAIRCADGNGRPVAPETLARLFTPAGCLVGPGDTDIGKAAILKAKSLIIEHGA